MEAIAFIDGEGGAVAILAGVCVATVIVLLVGAFISGRESKSFARRLETVQQRRSGSKANRDVSIRRNEPTGAFAGLDRVIGQWLPRRSALEARLARTGKKLTIAHYAIAVVLVFAAQTAVCLLVFGLSPLLSILIGVGPGLLIPHMVVGHLGARRLKKFTALFPEAIDLIVRGLRSGLPVSESIHTVGRELADPIGAEFRRIDQVIRLGQSIEDAMWEAAQRIDTPEFKFFIISLSVQRETGGNLAETLENLSDILRRRRAMRLKIKALSSEARASAYIIGSLPFLMFGILLLINSEYVLQLFSDPRGLVMVGVGLFSISLGVAVMAKMVRFEI